MAGGYAVLNFETSAGDKLPNWTMTLYDPERIPTPPTKVQAHGQWWVMAHPMPEEPDSFNHVEARYRPGK